MNKRYIIYPIIILGVVSLLLLPGFLANPRRNINKVISASTNSNQTVFKSFSSWYKKYPDGFILVFHTGGDAKFGDVEFVTISKHMDVIYVELIKGPGEGNVQRLTNQDAEAYLKEHEIDINEFNE